MKPILSNVKSLPPERARKSVFSAIRNLFFAYIAIMIGCGVLPSGGQESAKNGSAPEVRRAIPVENAPIESQRGTQILPSGRSGVESPPSKRPAAPAKSVRPPPQQDDFGSKELTPNTMAGLNDKRAISIGDKISLNIVEDETAARSLAVTDSGEIEVPYIGRVAVGGKTCKQLAFHVKKLLEKEYYYEATVLISLDSAGARSGSRGRFYLSGQVLRPSQYELPVDEVLTVSKAILRAGGFSQYANKKKVRLMRSGVSKEKLETIFIDVNAILEKGDAGKDVELLPEDSIFVDEKFFNFK